MILSEGGGREGGGGGLAVFGSATGWYGSGGGLFVSVWGFVGGVV